MRWNVLPPLVFGSLLLVGACGGDDDTGDDTTVPEGVATYSVAGSVHDFLTGEPIASGATVSTSGLVPAPTVSVQGADFTIDGIPAHSVFHILAGAPPTHRSTYNVATEVLEDDLSSLQVYALSEEYIQALADAFGAASGSGILLGRLVDDQGDPMAGIPGTAFQLDPGVEGPFFLDESLQAAPDLSESSSSGYFVLFSVQPGLARVEADPQSPYGLSMADSPVAATAVTLASVRVTNGQPELPSNVSFTNDVAPIFLRRGCTSCHDGGGIGKDLGGLHLNGAVDKMYRELVEELSPSYNTLRVNIQAPELSLLLTMPSAEDPPDRHPNVTFASPDDPDYLTIKAWISEGALKN